MEATDPDRRVDDLGREAFDRAVTQAATIATQRVAEIHRRRLVAQAALVTFCVCVGMALVLGLVLKGAADNQARDFALVNCRLVRAMALPMAEFVESDARLREQQGKLAGLNTQIGERFAHIFGAKNYVQALKESSQLNAQTVAYWRTTVVSQLKAVAGADCELRLP